MRKMIDVERWKEGGPCRAYAEYMAAWQRRDYDGMVKHCQRTWADDSYGKDPAEVLRYVCDNIEIMQLVYVDPVDAADMGNAGLAFKTVMDLNALVVVRIRGKNHKWRYRPRLVRERAAYRPDPMGTWGVNPVTALKRIARKKGKAKR